MTEKVSLKQKLGFGAGEFASSIFFTVTSFWLMNFLTDNVGLAAGLAGSALLIGKIWDSAIDPFIGYISDHTKTRWGRRRPFFLFFAIPVGVAFVFMFKNPHIASQPGKFWWALLMYMFFSMVYSFTNIPYNALLPDISKDYNERTNISGYKQLFAVIGTLVGAGAAVPIMSLFKDKETGFVGMAAIFGVLAVISILMPFFTVKEKPAQPEPKGETFWTSMKDVFTNKPFLLILGSWITNTTGVAIIETMLIYYYKYVFNAESSVTLALLILLVVTLAFIPIWIKISHKLGKRLTYIIGMSITSVSVVIFSFFGPALGIWISLGIMIFAGIGFSTHYVMPWSIVPDSIEYGYSKTGVRREGFYYSFWTFFISVGGALAGFLVGTGLEISGYVPNVSQSARSLMGIQLLIGPIPVVLFLLGNLCLAFYPLNKQRYEEVQADIKVMEERGG
jgi:glycoside/pentoside/hexuronide:cation symporter, GPH family